jgi:Family of unknown function (DUF6328)
MSDGGQPDDDNDLDEDRELHELHDRHDRKELRQRYYGLLQELRVVLPGVQVLVAFLLTVPFAQRFPELDDRGRFAYGVSLLASLLSVICLLTPTVYHRMAKRTERTARLRWGIRMTITGQWLIAVALVSGLWCVSRLVFGFRAAWVLTAPVAVAIVTLWLLLPKISGDGPDRPGAPRPGRPTGAPVSSD